LNWLNSITDWFTKLSDSFYHTLIEDGRWTYLFKGLGVTIEITFFSALIGIVLGCLVALIRSTYDKTGKLGFLNAICKVYLTVIRGTPVMIQLILINFVIFASVTIPKVAVAIIGFSINSGAYVAEIVRGGIMSIDNGQFEAGRSLGFGYPRTMLYIVLPQTFKNVLPALCNEFIVLLKETSVAAYIALEDLTRAGAVIQGITYNAFWPYISVAVIYLVVVLFFSFLVTLLERRLRSSDH